MELNILDIHLGDRDHFPEQLKQFSTVFSSQKSTSVFPNSNELVLSNIGFLDHDFIHTGPQVDPIQNNIPQLQQYHTSQLNNNYLLEPLQNFPYGSEFFSEVEPLQPSYSMQNSWNNNMLPDFRNLRNEGLQTDFLRTEERQTHHTDFLLPSPPYQLSQLTGSSKLATHTEDGHGGFYTKNPSSPYSLYEGKCLNLSLPGPIPASSPEILFDDRTGDQLLSFLYSKRKVVKKFLIRCPRIELSEPIEYDKDFLLQNCVYPGAMVPSKFYKGRRRYYEMECNTIGWRLAASNPELRGCRGLIQRAVDSWRNTRKDLSLRSRRVRKELKRKTSQKGKIS